MAIYQLGDLIPQIDPTAYIDENAVIIGNVKIGAGSSVWACTTIRGDNAAIVIGANTSIQENSVLHVDEGVPLTVGNNVTVGHQVMLHGCTIGDGALIGIQAVVLNGAQIGPGSLVGACALVTEGKIFPERSMILGSPAKVVRTLSEEDSARFGNIALHYVEQGLKYRSVLKRIG